MNPQGIGLGLTICNKILNELGSDLQVESKIGLDTTFFFNIEMQVIQKSYVSFNEMTVG